MARRADWIVRDCAQATDCQTAASLARAGTGAAIALRGWPDTLNPFQKTTSMTRMQSLRALALIARDVDGVRSVRNELEGK